MILAIQLAGVLALLTVGEPLLGWFGAEFTPAYLALLLLAAAETIQGAFSVSDLLLLYQRARLALAVTFAMIAVHLLTAVPLIGIYGMNGVAFSVLVAIASGALLRRWLVRSRFGLAPPLLHCAGPLIAALAAAIVAVAAHRYVAVNAPLSFHLGALAVVLAVYAAAILVWQRATGETLRLTGFRAA
jgi:O-antigen/teichoic acid export membrane protein